MNKLSRKEASDVLTEARRLQEVHKDAHSRLSQSIWWCSSEYSTLPEELQTKLYLLIDKHRGTELDFYHLTDDNRVMECFYKHYVEQGE